MPIIDVTYDHHLGDDALARLADVLPNLVAEAVDCPDEPWTGPPGVGDIEIRFRPRSPHDIGQLRVVVEVRTKWFESRASDVQRRADLIRDRLDQIELGPIGVWLILAEGAWSQV